MDFKHYLKSKKTNTRLHLLLDESIGGLWAVSVILGDSSKEKRGGIPKSRCA